MKIKKKLTLELIEEEYENLNQAKSILQRLITLIEDETNVDERAGLYDIANNAYFNIKEVLNYAEED